MKFDCSNKFDFCYYGQVNSLAMTKIDCSFEMGRYLNTFGGTIYFAGDGIVKQIFSDTRPSAGPQAQQHRSQRGLRAENPWLWPGEAHGDGNDRLCGHALVQGPGNHAQLDALQPDGYIDS